MLCKKCNSDRVVFIYVDGKDLCSTSFKGVEHDGYALEIKNVSQCGGAVEVGICLECGQTQGEWPVADPVDDDDDDDDEELDEPDRLELATKQIIASHGINKLASETFDMVAVRFNVKREDVVDRFLEYDENN